MILLRQILLLYTGSDELSGVDLLIEGNRITRIAKAVEPQSQDAEVIDCRDIVVLPGLVNTHHHLFQTLQRCLPDVQNAPLFRWLVRLYQIWKGMDDDAVYWSTLLGCAELLKTGCTTTSDNLYVFPRGASKFIDVEIEAAQKIGIRFHPTRGCMSLGQSKGGLPPDEIVQDEDEILADSERLINKYHDTSFGSMIRIALGPCSPFSVSRKLLIETKELAREKGVLLHTHLAETEDENKYCLEKYGMRPLELMEECGWLGSDVWFAHGIHFTDAEIKRLEETGTGVCHCPTSNMRLGSGVARIPEMLEMGIRVGLGVDGSASNDTSDMLGELRNCLLLHRLTGGSEAMGVRDVLRLATAGGASLLGRDDIGTIAEGRVADLIGIKISDIAYAGALHDYLASVLLCGYDHSVEFSIIDGKLVVKEGHVCAVSEEEIIRNANRIAKKLAKS